MICIVTVFLADAFGLVLCAVHSLRPLLTVCFTSGEINLMNNYDDLSPIHIRSGLKGENTCTNVRGLKSSPFAMLLFTSIVSFQSVDWFTVLFVSELCERLIMSV